MMMMDDHSMHKGTPWLDQPIELHSSREYNCSVDTAQQCTYQQGYWRFWYEADHRYALPTVAFLLVAIILFAIGHLVPWPQKSLRRAVAVIRYFSYRTFRVGALDWNSAPLGVLLLGAVGVIFFMCMTLAPKPYYWPNTKTLSYGNSPPIATRSGWMSLACLPFVIATAGKSNLITLVTGVSHERLQVFHRWISYAMYILALIHTFPFIVFHVWKGDMVKQWNTSIYYWTGVVALLAQSWLTFASFGPLRNIAYEWFKCTHFLAVLVFVLFLFFHCDFTLTSVDYFIATGVLFSLSWLHRQIRIYFEHGLGLKATVTLTANGFIRISVPTTSTWGVGQHYFVRLLSFGLHVGSIHPFTACSLPVRQAGGESELVFYIRPQRGFTARLAKHAERHPNSQIRLTLDGPYGGMDTAKLSQSKRMLVFAGGSGAGWMLPLLTAYLRRLEAPSETKPTMRLVLATRDMATRHWFEEAVVDILSSFSLTAAPAGLEITVHYTSGDENEREPQKTGQFLSKLDDPEKAPIDHPVYIRSDSDSDALRPRTDAISDCSRGRPDLPSIVATEVAAAPIGSSLGIFVCGPLSMQNDVANAAAESQLSIIKGEKKEVYLHMEHFSWA